MTKPGGQCSRCTDSAAVTINGVGFCWTHRTNPNVAPVEAAMLRVPEVAKILGLPRSSVYELVANGEIPGVRRLGRRWLINRAELDRWIQTGGTDQC